MNRYLNISLLIFSLNSRRFHGAKSRFGPRQTVSMKRKFNFSSSARIEQLKRIQLKKKTEAKVNWAVRAYNEWRNNRLYNFQYDVGIYYADLNDLANLEKCNLQHALCHFLPEVTKVKGEGLYPGATLYQMVVAIQKYLNVNKVNWKLIDDVEFSELKVVLDNLMKERTALNVGVTKKQAQVISYQDEQNLWKTGVLGEDSPDKLRNTVLFLIGINVFLRAVEEHYYLRRPMENGTSQLTFERNSKGDKCLVYREDSITKTHDGGLNDMRRERKIVWVFPSENKQRCPVRLVEKYLSLCPKNFTKRDNFYLQSLVKPSPKQWYGCQVVGQNTIGKVVKEMMSKANIEGFFTNRDSLQIVTETTMQNAERVCTCGVNGSNVGDIINSIVKESAKNKKTIVKFQIEITHE